MDTVAVVLEVVYETLLIFLNVALLVGTWFR